MPIKNNNNTQTQNNIDHHIADFNQGSHLPLQPKLENPYEDNAEQDSFVLHPWSSLPNVTSPAQSGTETTRLKLSSLYSMTTATPRIQFTRKALR